MTAVHCSYVEDSGPTLMARGSNVYILRGRGKPREEKRGRNLKTKDAWVASTSADHGYDGK